MIPYLGPEPSEELGTKSCMKIPAPDPAPASAKALWKMEMERSSSVSTGVVKLSVTPPADAPIGEYSLTAEHRDESHLLGKLVLLFNPWCPGRFVHPRDGLRPASVKQNPTGEDFHGILEQ